MVRFVLVRPRDPNNASAAARALANFGFADLFAVDPFEAHWKEAKAAPGAEAVLTKARTGSLDEALADRTYVIGTHDGRRKNGPEAVDLPALSLPKGKIAILFGPEKTGLSNEELARCHAAARIPTVKDCPSMNLAQAVAVVAYELSRTEHARAEPALPAMTDAQREALVSQGVALCRKLAYRPNDPDAVLAKKFRDLLLRRPLLKEESATLQALLRRLA